MTNTQIQMNTENIKMLILIKKLQKTEYHKTVYTVYIYIYILNNKENSKNIYCKQHILPFKSFRKFNSIQEYLHNNCILKYIQT